MAKRNDVEVNAIIRENKDLSTSELEYRLEEVRSTLTEAEAVIAGLQQNLLTARKAAQMFRQRLTAFETLVEGRR